MTPFGSTAFGLLPFGAAVAAILPVPTPSSRVLAIPASGVSSRLLRTKSPEEALDFAIDWSAPLAGDAIVGSVWTISRSGLQMTKAAASGFLNTVWLAGGAPGVFYDVTNTVATQSGRTESASFVLEVLARNYL